MHMVYLHSTEVAKQFLLKSKNARINPSRTKQKKLPKNISKQYFQPEVRAHNCINQDNHN